MKVTPVSWRHAGNHLNADSEVSQFNRHIHMAGSLILAAYTYGSSGPIMVSASIFRAIS
jgi:hypothetical protein